MISIAVGSKHRLKYIFTTGFGKGKFRYFISYYKNMPPLSKLPLRAIPSLPIGKSKPVLYPKLLWIHLSYLDPEWLVFLLPFEITKQ